MSMKCFLLYSYNTQVSAIVRLLSENAISYLSPIESFYKANTVTSAVIQQVKECDFVVAVIDKTPTIYFTLGLAVALKKHVFIIVPEQEERQISDFFSDVTYTIANPDDYEKIKYSFNIFIERLPKKEKRKPKVQLASRAGGRKLTNREYEGLSRQLTDLSKQASGLQFENFVLSLFKKLNIDILASNSNKATDFQADFSVWIDELDTFIGNPILVETKSNSYSSREGIQQLLYQLSKYNARTGVLIYNDPNHSFNSSTSFHFAPLVLAFSIQELLRELTVKTFSEIILERRNYVVHAISPDGRIQY